VPRGIAGQHAQVLDAGHPPAGVPAAQWLKRFITSACSEAWKPFFHSLHLAVSLSGQLKTHFPVRSTDDTTSRTGRVRST